MDHKHKGMLLMDIGKRLCQLGLLSLLLLLTHYMYSAPSETNSTTLDLRPAFLEQPASQEMVSLGNLAADPVVELLTSNPYFSQPVRMGSPDVYKLIPTGPGVIGMMVLGENHEFRTMIGGHVNTAFIAMVYNWDW